MIRPDKLDEALRIVAIRMNGDQSRALLQRWLRYFPSSIYPFIVAEYRRLTGQSSFSVLMETGQYSAEARMLMLELAKPRQTGEQPVN